MLWIQRKRRKAVTESAEDEGKSPDSHKAKNGSWIKSHFSRLSEEKLLPNSASTCSNPPQPESGSGEASTTIHMETVTTRHGEGGTAVRRESFTSRQKAPGSSVIKETHKESGIASSSNEATWAAVAACTREIDNKGRQLANSMLQRATAYQHSGHLESRDINQEELKALEEVELKLKTNFLTQRENTIAGANHTHTFYGHGHHGHQSHQGHPGYQSHQVHPGHPSHQNHHGHQSHQGLPGQQNHQGHPGHLSHQGHPGHSNHQGHLGHQSHPVHSSHQSHSLPNRNHQIYDSCETT
ncbi:uncharacterized protein C10orf62 homolog [Nycticebus coucang]|uniref:uncharacterized protein C10orf62 homolog n=1 Tax=Nycticebus coucang TaxID=9470 RepID=UPI00234CACFC|nr:uncharacterized protein C10orf62 homolog [Nycticebus coucang]